MNALWIALGFLTRFPSKHADFNSADAARSVFWFPAVGALVGALVWACVHLTAPLLGHDLAAFVALGVWVWVTGALHLDGLADTFDGFSACNAGKTRALEAMKDSRIGAHGACALGLMLLGKWVVMRRCIEIGAIGPAVVVAAMVARWGVGFLLAWVPSASSSGLGVLFAEQLKSRRGRWIPLTSALWLLLALGGSWLLPLAIPRQAAVLSIVVSVFCAALALLAFTRRCQACFGGVTGDTHGAAIELSEVLVMTVHAAVFGLVHT